MERKTINRRLLAACGLTAMILMVAACGPSGTFKENGEALVKDSALPIGHMRQLFVDDYIIERVSGAAALRLHHPERREVALVYDEPWEGAGCGYENIFRDGDIYRLYYKAWHRSVGPGSPNTDKQPLYCCYAESRDGIHWQKPKLGLHAFRGSRANNIVIAPDIDSIKISAGEPSVFKDENPDAPAAARYKAFFPMSAPVRGLIALQSADGIHWEPTASKPVITDGAFDSQNLAFWDPLRKEYRAYWRYFAKGVRSVRTATSKDFVHWGGQEDLRYSDTLTREQLYTNQIRPYYRAPQIFIGFPARYVDRGWSPSMRALPDSAHRVWRSSIEGRLGTALTDGLIMASHDGVHFKRWNEAFLRPGIERPGTWSYGQQYIAWQMVETRPEEEEGAPNEISLYATEHYWTGKKASQLRRYTIRLDGFVSVNAPMSGGELITKPFVFSGDSLELNFSTSASGSLWVEVQDAAGNPIPGFTADAFPVVFGDAVDRNVQWAKANISSLQGRSIRLRFVLKDADLYAFRFH